MHNALRYAPRRALKELPTGRFDIHIPTVRFGVYIPTVRLEISENRVSFFSFWNIETYYLLRNF